MKVEAVDNAAVADVEPEASACSRVADCMQFARNPGFRGALGAPSGVQYRTSTGTVLVPVPAAATSAITRCDSHHTHAVTTDHHSTRWWKRSTSRFQPKIARASDQG